MDHKTGYPKGTFTAIGIVAGLSFGVLLAISTGNFGLLGIGPAFGLPIGLALEEHYSRKGVAVKHRNSSGKDRNALFLFLFGVILLGISGLIFFQ